MNRDIDETALTELGDPACTALLAAVPELDPSGGVLGMRKIAHDFFDTLPPAELPTGVTVRDLAASAAVPPLRVYEPEQSTAPGRGVLWIHGGGLIAGTPKHDDLVCAAIALDHRCPVVSVDYQLAPEAQYPVAVEECLAALEWTLDPASAGITPGQLVIEGASAGGGLAAALVLLAQERSVAGIAGVLLRYPMLDDRPSSSMQRAACTKTWHREADSLAWAAYLGDRDRTTLPPHAVPGRATVEELRAMPPVFVDVGTLDAFFEDDVDFVHKLAHAGVPVELVVTPGAFHGSELLNPDASTSRRITSTRTAARRRFLGQ